MTLSNTETERDQATSAFSMILEQLMMELPGALACVLVDDRGETVDYASQLPPFEAKLIAAHLQIVMRELPNEYRARGIQWALGRHQNVCELSVRCERFTYVVRQLPERYLLVIVLVREATFDIDPATMADFVARLATEAGFAQASAAGWLSVSVDLLPSGPISPTHVWIQGRRRAVTVIGRVAFPNKDGFRIRFDGGEETTLVCDAHERWFLDVTDAAQ